MHSKQVAMILPKLGEMKPQPRFGSGACYGVRQPSSSV